MEISKINNYLFVAPRNSVKDTGAVRDRNIGLIIDMVIHRRPPKETEDLKIDILSLPAVDFILLPIPIDLLDRGVKAALPVIEEGVSVLVYCEKGRHRSVAMACCILIAKGFTSDEAMALVKEKRERADPYAWHIKRQIRKYEDYWKTEKGGQ